MTTAHRPTFYQALGGENQAPTTKVSSRDLPGHTTLKRYNAQPRPMYSDDVPEQTVEDDREKLKTLLNKKEKEYYEKKERQKSIFGPIEAISDVSLSRSTDKVPRLLQALPESNDNAYPEDEDDCGPLVSNSNEKTQSLSQMNQESDDDTDDDEAELLRELEVIKRERQQDELSRTLHSENETRSQEHINILQSNPLMIHQDTTLKRRWDDDVVFRNQAKNICKPKKRFINDTVRSDFHKKFLARYIQ